MKKRSLASVAFLASMSLSFLSGCSALSVCRNATPAVCVRPNIIDAPRSSQEPINFIFLRQDPPPAYLLGPRDVLGIYIEGVLGALEESPPVHFAEDSNIPPAMGYPVPVREDGTLSLPLVTPIRVEGLTVTQTEEAIRRAYTVQRKILQPGKDRIITTLMRRRTYQVLVIREDATSKGVGIGGGGNILGSAKQGETYTVELPAYENDILHALSESGGLPGLDAKNMVTVIRGGYGQGASPDRVLAALLNVKEETRLAKTPPFLREQMQREANQQDAGSSVQTIPASQGPSTDEVSSTATAREADLAAAEQALARSFGNESRLGADVQQAGHQQPIPMPIPAGPAPGLPPGTFTPPLLNPDGRILQLLPSASNVLKIPLRAIPGEPLPLLSQEDITLNTGDVIYIESRDAEVFYTGGMLSGGQHQIPRDYDLDVLGAISMAGGVAATSGQSGGFNAIGGGGGGGGRGGAGGICPPTQVTIIRMVDGQQTIVRASIKRLIVNPNERILIQPNDIVMLEYTPMEMMFNILLNNLQFNYFLNNTGGN